jgi:APA family basic amino acid/polyamine antiporter
MEKDRGGDATSPEKPKLGLWDAVSIIVGIVIGSTIYKSPQLIMSNVSSPTWGLAAWALGGVLSLIGALCYAELATTYPRSGGDYVYLSRAFGRWCGFLFGWAQLSVILTSSIAMMAFVFGDYAVKVWQPRGTDPPPELVTRQKELAESVKRNEASGSEKEQLADVETQIKGYGTAKELWTAGIAAAAVLVLALTNSLGVVLGKWTQNLLSLLKVVGLGSIVFAGFHFGQADVLAALPEAPKETSFGLAMIFVLYAYGGWNDAAFVAAEMRSRRTIIWSLILGVSLVTIIYLAVNAAYLRALGFEGMRQSWTVAADVGKMARGDKGSLAISVLVMVSALGAINGLTFTGSRVYSTLGTENSIFALMGRWNRRFGSPVWAIAFQAVVSLAMIAAVGTPFGRDLIDTAMKGCGNRLHEYLNLDTWLREGMPWTKYFGGFDTLLSGTAPVFWGFFLLSGLALFALRQRDPHIERRFHVPLFPLLPLIFCGMCAYMLYSALDYAKSIALIGALPLALGLPLYWISRQKPGSDDTANPSLPSDFPLADPRNVTARRP